MKKFALVLGMLMILAAVSGAAAQSSPPAQNPSGSTSVDAKSPSGSASVDVNVNKSEPAPRPGVDVNINKKDETTVRSDRDSGAALPRAASGERTTVFGLSPTAAVIIAAALLVVVILAIVAMTRSGAETTYIDRGGRPPVV
jgi:hypothetical protein